MSKPNTSSIDRAELAAALDRVAPVERRLFAALVADLGVTITTERLMAQTGLARPSLDACATRLAAAVARSRGLRVANHWGAGYRLEVSS